MKKLIVLAALLCSACLYSRTLEINEWSELDPDRVKPGTTIIWNDGTITDQIIKISWNGTPEAPIVIKAKNPGKVVFTGTCRIEVSGSHLDISGLLFENPSTRLKGVFKTTKTSSYVHIHNCCIRSNETLADIDPSRSTRYNWMYIQGSYHEIDHCSFIGKLGLGLMLDVQPTDEQTPMFCSIHNNYFHRPNAVRNEKGSAINGQESFRIGLSQTCWCAAKCVASENWFDRCNGEIEVISNKCSDNVYESNLLDNCEGMITLRHGNNCTVRQNIILGGGVKSSGGIRVIGSGHKVESNIIKNVTGSKATAALAVVTGSNNPKRVDYWPADNCVIENNVVIDCQEALAINFKTHLEGQIAPKGLVVKNNKFILGDDANSVTLFSIPQKEIKFVSNVIFGGIQTECKLKTTGKRPSEPDFTSRAQSIRDGAGCSFIR